MTESISSSPEAEDAPSGGVAPLPARLERDPKERTVQVSLRMPANWVALLRRRALAAAHAEDTIITPQEIVRRMIAAALKTNP